MEVINPLSLLEVTMGEDTNDDNDCIIIEDNEESQNYGNGGCLLNTIYHGEKMEVEVDPLYVAPSEVCNSKQSNMNTLWVATNINNLASASLAEAKFRKMKYQNVYEVLKERLHCSICLDHVGCDIRVHPNATEHPVLKVLVCEKCAIAYRTVHFPLNEKGKELSCRWCGKVSSGASSPLKTCQQCPFSFCELCLYNNYPNFDEACFPGSCFVCNMKALWPARATLWALQSLKNLLLTHSDSEIAKINGDISLCCKGKRTKKKKIPLQNDPTTFVEPVDLDQLVPPHLLNGSDEPDLQSNQPQPISLNALAIFKSCPRAPKHKIIKPRARPKTKTKPKPKMSVQEQTPVLQPKQQLSTQQESLVVSPEYENKNVDVKKPHWLRTKLLGYMNDFDQLKTKLEDVEKSLDADESHNKTDEKIDAITTLLSLQGDLLKSCRMNLINEWKERKTRLVLENYHPNVHEINGNTILNPLISPVVHVTSAKQKKKSKAKSIKKRSNTGSNVNRKQCDGVKIIDKHDYGIKDCFVKLNKLKMPLPAVEKDCFIRLDRIDVPDDQIQTF